jgi:hypothetical protein
MLKKQLMVILSNIQNQSSRCGHDYTSGFLDGQEAMLENVLEMIEVIDNEFKEYDNQLTELLENK